MPRFVPHSAVLNAQQPHEAERDALSPAMARQKARAMALRARSKRAQPMDDGTADVPSDMASPAYRRGP